MSRSTPPAEGQSTQAGGDTDRRLREAQAQVAELAARCERVDAERRALRRLHERVWRMRSAAEIGEVLDAVEAALVELGVPFRGCGINLVEGAAGVPAVRQFQATKGAGSGRWTLLGPDESDLPLVAYWQAGVPAYRPDLHAHDPHGELPPIEEYFGFPVRTVLDVPFSHGTLALNSSEADAFTPQDIAFVEGVARALSEGFQRAADLYDLEERERQAEAAAASLARALRLEQALGRMRQRVLGMRSVADLPLGSVWREELRGLGVPVDGFSVQMPGSRPGFFRSSPWAPAGAASELPLKRFPWVAEAWTTGKPVLVPRARLSGAHLAKWRARFLLEVPLVGGGSVGVNTEGPDPFDEEMTRTVVAMAGLVAEGLRRAQDFEALVEREEQLRQAQKMAAVGQLAGGIAHHFNNMLQAIVGNLQLAAMDATAVSRAHLRAAERVAFQEAEMIRQLETLTRPGPFPERASVSLPPVLQDSVAVSRLAGVRRVEVAIDVPEELPAVRGNAGQLRQVFLNLLLNARDAVNRANRDAATVRVRAEAAVAGDGSGPWVRVTVADNGVGMTDETRRRAFEPFFTTKPVDQGRGLGLAVVYGIVQQHAGRVECDSVLGEGTAFRVYLPIAEDQA